MEIKAVCVGLGSLNRNVPGPVQRRVGSCPSCGKRPLVERGATHAGSPPLPCPRLSPKPRGESRKTGSQRSSGSRSPSLSGGSGWGSPQQNGGSRQRSGAQGGRPGLAQSPPDVRMPGFAEGSCDAPCWGGGVAAARGGSERVTGRGGGAARLPQARRFPLLRPPLSGSGLECLVVMPTWL